VMEYDTKETSDTPMFRDPELSKDGYTLTIFWKGEFRSQLKSKALQFGRKALEKNLDQQQPFQILPRFAKKKSELFDSAGNPSESTPNKPGDKLEKICTILTKRAGMKETERKTVFEYGPDECPGYSTKRFKPEIIKEVEKKNPSHTRKAHSTRI